MSVSRREKIEALLQDEPRDQFLRYGLAVELDNEGHPEESLSLFRELMRDQPQHVASFFRGAQLLLKLDKIDQARTALREGIEIARQQGDLHTAGEMGELLASLGALGE